MAAAAWCLDGAPAVAYADGVKMRPRREGRSHGAAGRPARGMPRRGVIGMTVTVPFAA